MADIQLFNMDCMEAMKDMADNEYDLAIVDPPYFDGPQRKNYYKGTKQICEVGNYKDLSGTWEVPNSEYFKELARVSKNQIIWGCNYYSYPLSGGRIVWLKGVENSPFSMCEIAYHSFYKRIDLFKYLWAGFWKESGNKEKRIHPTQKPVALYKWLLQKYAKPNDKILDTHLGSGSIALACHDDGFDLTGFELDKEYYEVACERLEKHQMQPTFEFN